jgi:hypothetical protein
MVDRLGRRHSVVDNVSAVSSNLLGRVERDEWRRQSRVEELRRQELALKIKKESLRREQRTTQLTGGSQANLRRTGNDAPSTYSLEKSLSGRTVDVRRVLLICCKYYEEAVWRRHLFT